MNRSFSRGDRKQAYEKMLNVIREMQIKTTMRYYFTLISMANIKESDDNKC